eukprot:356869-Chlamydomonas_euryale.AAC.2
MSFRALHRAMPQHPGPRPVSSNLPQLRSHTPQHVRGIAQKCVQGATASMRPMPFLTAVLHSRQHGVAIKERAAAAAAGAGGEALGRGPPRSGRRCV